MLEMPKIKMCDVTDCSYNKNRECHAAAITVGGEHPYCDTYMRSPSQKGGVTPTGEVGACKVENCKFNRMLECTADGINVGFHQEHADCMTFSPK